MNIGDLVRSQKDVNEGIEGPLGIIVDIDRNKKGKPRMYYVFHFKLGRVEEFNAFYEKLVKFRGDQ